MSTLPKIIAVDFDGTLFENAWPDVGAPIEKNINKLKAEQADGAKVILWTNRVGGALDKAVNFCKERGLSSHYEDKDWDLFHCKEIETAPEWDGHTDKDVERVLSLTDDDEADSWAKKEVELACESERSNTKTDDEAWYGVNCYESALRAYRSLEKDGHSGFSIQITKSISIEDTPDIWTEVNFGEDDPVKHFQCKRMSSLFKDISPDGQVSYNDVNRVQVVYIDNPDNSWTNGTATRLVDKIFPITMPYLPSSKKFKIIAENFLVDEKNGDYDTVGYLKLITPDGKTIELNAFFKDGEKDMVRIRKEEYEERKAAAKARKETSK